jgi:hypothetical protein
MSFHDDSIPSWLGQEGHEASTQQWLEDQTFRFANSSPAPDPSTAPSMQQLYNPPPKADPTLKTEQGQHQNTNFDNPLYSLPFYNNEVRQAREPSPDTARLDEELRAEQARYNSWRRIWRDRLDPGELPVWFGKDEFALWSEWWMEDENSAVVDTDSLISLSVFNLPSLPPSLPCLPLPSSSYPVIFTCLPSSSYPKLSTLLSSPRVGLRRA